MKGVDVHIRPATSEDLTVLAGREDGHRLSQASAAGWTVHVVEQDGELVAAGWLDPLGLPQVEPTSPAVRLTPVGRMPVDVISALVRTVEQEANSAGHERLMVGWDPMDAHGLRRLAELGYRPTGRGPYFELGHDQVQYVTGYQDAVGATLDLVKRFDRA